MSDAISLKDNKITIDENKCRGCGLCANICKPKAINIEYQDDTINSIINRMNNLIEYDKK